MSVSVLEKCPGLQPKVESMCRPSVEGGIKKALSALKKCRVWHPLNGVCFRANSPGWHPKMCVKFLEMIPGWQQKLASVSKRSVDGCTQIGNQCPREESKLAARKWRHCVGEMSRVAPKYGITVLGKCTGWQTTNGVSVQARSPGSHTNFASVS
jgi:hypothetical protein